MQYEPRAHPAEHGAPPSGVLNPSAHGALTHDDRTEEPDGAYGFDVGHATQLDNDAPPLTVRYVLIGHGRHSDCPVDG